MKLLVLAQTPPPLHGQSVMVQALVSGLPTRGITVRHVNLQLSRNSADLGRWRPGKMIAVLRAALGAVEARIAEGFDTLYYVPAPPAKRGALYRDWAVMAMCRPFFRRLVLHWHAAGLGEWLARRATAPERWISHRLLGCSDLAVVVANATRADIAAFHARRTVIVPNGVADPGDPPPPPPSAGPFRVLFLGACCEEKGVFAAAEAVVAANRAARPDAAEPPAFVLVAAGAFEGAAGAERWHGLAARHEGVLHYAGAVHGDPKSALFAQAHAVCLPTRYHAEASPLVAIEALAHDRPVIATDWRGLPEVITPDVGRIVPPSDPAALLEALIALRRQPPAPGVCRARFLSNYTLDRHLSALAGALASLEHD